MIKSIKSLGYRDEQAYEHMRNHLRELGEHIHSCSKEHWENRGTIIKHDIYRIKNYTVVLEGVHELEIDNNPHYRYMQLQVSSNYSSEEETILSNLEAITRFPINQPSQTN